MDARIIALYDDTANAPILNNAINIVVHTIQKNIDIRYLSRQLKAIMNSWVRTHAWYNEDKLSKFEHCLRYVVTKEMRRQTIKRLEQQDTPAFPVNVYHLYDELQDAFHRLTSSDFWDIDTELTNEANNWVTNHGEHLIDSDFDRPFSWFSGRTMSTHYHLPHVSKNAENVHIIALELLPYDFRHEQGWECSICLSVDAEVATCVRTLCQHVFHESCMLNYKHVYLEQLANYKKTCVPCPLCRCNFH